MKRFYNYIGFLMVTVVFTSCLKAGLEDLETYDQAEMTNVRFEYRWWDEAKQQMRVMQLTTDKTINKDDRSIVCTITVPPATATFTQSIREKVSLENLAANVDISTAARIKPVDNAPILGSPADFSAKEFAYLITAADGKNSARWVIKISDFKK